MNFLTKLLSLVILGSFITTQVGCAALRKDLPTILTYIQDGALILNTIQSYSNLFFMAHPNDKLSAEVTSKINEAQTALDLALHATQGTQDLTDAQYVSAFAPFMTAYDDLLALTKQIGVTSSAAVTAPKAVPGGLVVPTPLVAVKLAK